MQADESSQPCGRKDARLLLTHAEQRQNFLRLWSSCTLQALDTICSLALALGPDFAVFFPAIQKVRRPSA